MRKQNVLTDSELEVLAWTAVGKSSSDIAAITIRSENTVNYHIKNAMDKLCVKTRAHAVSIVVRSPFFNTSAKVSYSHPKLTINENEDVAESLFCLNNQILEKSIISSFEKKVAIDPDINVLEYFYSLVAEAEGLWRVIDPTYLPEISGIPG